jgi:hypothetical protein
MIGRRRVLIQQQPLGAHQVGHSHPRLIHGGLTRARGKGVSLNRMALPLEVHAFGGDRKPLLVQTGQPLGPRYVAGVVVDQNPQLGHFHRCGVLRFGIVVEEAEVARSHVAPDA